HLVCDDCNKDFVSARGLRIHRSRIHKESVARENRSFSVALPTQSAATPRPAKKKRMGRAESDEPDEVVRSSRDEKECSHCGEVFDSRRAARSHEINYHGK
ncbi:hypothetical protein PENTCL1PPCAC_24682, partial [Pristionchus entomophagus]